MGKYETIYIEPNNVKEIKQNGDVVVVVLHSGEDVTFNRASTDGLTIDFDI